MAKEASNTVQDSVLKVPPILIIIGKTLQFVSPKFAAKFVAKLFISPIRFRMPRRELKMDSDSKQTFKKVPSINKEICIYEFGSSPKKILLVHGWSGRGTQLVKIAEKLIESGYSTISFDAPAHGKAKGKATDLKEFIEAVLYLDREYGPFEAAVGHSLGGMTILNAVKKGLDLRGAVLIGSGDIITEIIDDFVAKLELKPKVGIIMQTLFENKTKEVMNDFSASKVAASVNIPVLVIHDQDDLEVPVKCAYNIHKNLKNSELYITSGLGHRKILGNGMVVDKTINHIRKLKIK